MALKFRIASVAGLAAALSMAATPAAAADLPVSTARAAVDMPAAWNADNANADGYRGYRYRRHRGVDAGDVIAGVLVLGTIAAVASAASKNNRDRNYRDRDYRDRDYRDRDVNYRTRRNDSRYDANGGINNAVNMCVNEIERDVRVENVDSVDRSGDGWLVTGTIYNGEGFSCRIGNDGRVEGVNYGRGVAVTDDRQWGDDRYAQARAQSDTANTAVPAYPGGPLPGDVDGDLPEAPDYTG